MKMLRLFLTWPLIFAVAWYFFSFQIAVIVGLAYLHVITILLFQITEKQKEKLVEIVEYIKRKDGLIDPQKIVDPSTIETADDAINAIISLGK
jgi:predicted small secreted protein